MEAISIREAARRLGVHHAAVQKRIKAGTLAALPDGKLKWATVERQWTKNRDESKVRKPAANVGEPSSANEKTEGDFSDAKTRREYVRLEREKLQLGKLKGDLLDRRQVQEATFARARGVRDALLNIPSRISSLLAAESDPHAVQEMLRDEICAVLTRLVKEKPNRSKCRTRKKKSSTRIHRKKNS